MVAVVADAVGAVVALVVVPAVAEMQQAVMRQAVMQQAATQPQVTAKLALKVKLIWSDQKLIT